MFNGPPGQRSLYYDFMGNLTNEALPAEGYQQYSYDFLNRLTMLLDVASNMTLYRYDALGRRITKNYTGLQTHYVYDGAGLIEERDGTNAVLSSYLLGRDPDEVLSRRRWSGGSSSDIFYHTNSLGSVVAVTDNTGAVVERYKYDAYGQVTFLSPTFTPLTSSAVANPLLFTGRYYDVESKLYYFRARSYHPYLGRFLQRDPLGEAASLNLYNYVFNNPINATDPSGMWGIVPAEGHPMARAMMAQQSHLQMDGENQWQQGIADAEATMAAIPEQGLSVAEMKVAAGIKQEASKAAAQNGNKPFTLTLNLLRVDGSWEDQADGQANESIQKMWNVAKEIYGKYDITIQDQEGHTEAKDINVEVLGTSPTNGEASFAFLEGQGTHTQAINTIDVLFAPTLAPGTCKSNSAGCSAPDLHKIIIPERIGPVKSSVYAASGFESILAHEIGHQFGLHDLEGNSRSPYTGSLMFGDSTNRAGYSLSPTESFNLQLGSLPYIGSVKIPHW